GAPEISQAAKASAVQEGALKTSVRTGDKNRSVEEGKPAEKEENQKNSAGSGIQLSLFSGPLNPALDRIRKLNLMEITPSQAIHELEILQKLAEEED
ncbi:MAG: hypothetical protein LKH44_06905, partial [Eubacterium sp.]|nr:hypothetical protein [Eubacterium sp.]